MRKKYLLTTGILTAILMSGCGASNNNAETEALRQQITQLEQQIATLEEQAASASDNTDQAEAPADNTAGNTNTSDTQSEGNIRTMEELTAMVDAFVEKADAAAPSGTDQERMEQFFSLKQEESQIDRFLDLHEDELEARYRNGTLTREEYRRLERELEQLEDRLDDAEDRLERAFGIND